MNTLWCKLFKPRVYKRAMRIEKKKIARVDRLYNVIKELQEWDDIPLSWQFTSLCKKLHIKPNNAAYDFIFKLCFRTPENIHEVAKKLPLI